MFLAQTVLTDKENDFKKYFMIVNSHFINVNSHFINEIFSFLKYCLKKNQYFVFLYNMLLRGINTNNFKYV